MRASLGCGNPTALAELRPGLVLAVRYLPGRADEVEIDFTDNQRPALAYAVGDLNRGSHRVNPYRLIVDQAEPLELDQPSSGFEAGMQGHRRVSRSGPPTQDTVAGTAATPRDMAGEADQIGGRPESSVAVNEGAPPLLPAHDATQLQHLQGLDHRAPAHPELLDKLILSLDTVPRPVATHRDPLRQLVDGRVGNHKDYLTLYSGRDASWVVPQRIRASASGQAAGVTTDSLHVLGPQSRVRITTGMGTRPRVRSRYFATWLITWSSAGNLGFKGSRKGTPYAAQIAAEAAAKKAIDFGRSLTPSASSVMFMTALCLNAGRSPRYFRPSSRSKCSASRSSSWQKYSWISPPGEPS